MIFIFPFLPCSPQASPHLPPFHRVLEQDPKQDLFIYFKPLDLIHQCCWKCSGYSLALLQKRLFLATGIHVNGLEFQKTKLLFLPLRQWRNRLVWVELKSLLKSVYFGQKKSNRGNLYEKTGKKVCVCMCVCSHSTCLTYDSVLSLQLIDRPMRVQETLRFGSRDHTGTISPGKYRVRKI